MNINIYEYEKQNKIIYDGIREYSKAEKVNEEYLRSLIKRPDYLKGSATNMNSFERQTSIKNTIMNTTFDLNRIRIIAYIILAISGLFVMSTTGWVLTENRNVLVIMEILTMLSSLAIVLLFAELYKGCSESKKSLGLIALVLSSCMATLTIINHFLYMTI